MMDEQIEKALEVLKRGGIILYPTDTVWGIGCDATNASAVDKIYALKNSDDKKSMLMLVDKIDNVARYVGRVPDVAWQLMEVSDKPLTLILPNGCGVAQNLIPEEGTIGVRVPNHDFCQKLLRRLGRPLVSTSANISGQATPSAFSEISKEVISGVDFVVDYRCEGNPTRKASSIIRLGESGEITIIRE